MLTETQRTAILEQQLFELARDGAHIQARTPTSAVVQTGTPVNHVLHLLVSVFLCGLWLPVWLMISAFGGAWTRTVTVDENGQIHDSHDTPAKSHRIFGWTMLSLVILIVLAFALRWG